MNFPVAISEAANKVGDAVPHAVMGALLGMSGLHGSVFWVGFESCIWLASTHSRIALSGGAKYNNSTVTTTLAPARGRWRTRSLGPSGPVRLDVAIGLRRVRQYPALAVVQELQAIAT